jgi:hypothetical protein
VLTILQILILKTWFRRIIFASVSSEVIYRSFEKSLGWVVDYARICRRELVNDRRIRGCPRLSFIRSQLSSLTVQNGPFAGMRYPKAASVGSALVPKLIGCYEQELHPVIEAICSDNYSTVVDVGCAEGYYAVGFGMRLSNASIMAFDTNDEAITLCNAMARLNNVSSRLITGGFCSDELLTRLPLGARALVVCDCEGFELTLLSESTIPFLERHDILVELHDFVHLGASSEIRSRFEKTHFVESYFSIADAQKAVDYDYAVLQDVPQAEREFLIGEGRPCIMEWFFLRSRHNACC